MRLAINFVARILGPRNENDTKVASVAVGAVMAGAAFALLGMKAFQARGAAGYDLSKGGVTVPMKHTMSKTTASAWLKGSTEAV